MWIPGPCAPQILAEQEIDEDWKSAFATRALVILLQVVLGSHFRKHCPTPGGCLGACLDRLSVAGYGEELAGAQHPYSKVPARQWRELQPPFF